MPPRLLLARGDAPFKVRVPAVRKQGCSSRARTPPRGRLSVTDIRDDLVTGGFPSEEGRAPSPFRSRVAPARKEAGGLVYSPRRGTLFFSGIRSREPRRPPRGEGAVGGSARLLKQWADGSRTTAREGLGPQWSARRVRRRWRSQDQPRPS